MPTVLHVASVFPSNSNRLALQFGYACDEWSIELLHLSARRADVSSNAGAASKVYVLPHSPEQRVGDSYFVRRIRSLLRRVSNSVALYMRLLRCKAEIMHAHENSSMWAMAFWVLLLRRPAVWDPHDYFHEPRDSTQRSPRLFILKALERAVVRHGTQILSVSDGMREKYTGRLPEATHHVIRNYSSVRGAFPGEGESVRERAHRLAAKRSELGGGRLRLVYPGLIKAERFSMSLIKVIGSLEGIDLDIYGEDRSGDGKNQSALESVLQDNEITNIHLRGPYTSDNIIELLGRYHLAIFPYQLTHPNIDFCLPNKFFQCIEAGIPLVTTNMKEMGGIVLQHGLGHVFPAGDNAACARILESCAAPGEEYETLVQNVLTYCSNHIDYAEQRSTLLNAYIESAGGRCATCD